MIIKEPRSLCWRLRSLQVRTLPFPFPFLWLCFKSYFYYLDLLALLVTSFWFGKTFPFKDSTVVQWLAPHSEKVSRLNPTLARVFHCGTCSPHVGFLRVLRLPFTVQRHADWGLGLLTVAVNGCLSLYVGPVIRWWPVHGLPRLSPNISWDWLQLHRDPQGIRSEETEWMHLDSKSVPQKEETTFVLCSAKILFLNRVRLPVFLLSMSRGSPLL